MSRSRSRSRSSDLSSNGSYGRKSGREGLVKWRRGTKIRRDRYEVMGIAGQGTFGTVLDVYDSKHRERVALKVVRSVERYNDAAHIEIDILTKLRKKDPNKMSFIVRLYGAFTATVSNQTHVCITFEMLGISLYDFIKKNNYRGFQLNDVRVVARQLIHAVRFCHMHKLTHTDLKLENVLFVDDSYDLRNINGHERYRVPRNLEIRLIDFGGATFETERHAKIINTRQYRGPEVIFGLKWSYPSDLWSIGCIIAELFCGELLFQTHNDGEHLALMEKILGSQIPTKMVAEGLLPYSQGSYRLPEAPLNEIFDAETHKIKWPEIAKSSDSRRHVRKQEPLEKFIEDPHLCDLISKCLDFETDSRITCQDAYKHPFFTEGTPDCRGITFDEKLFEPEKT